MLCPKKSTQKTRLHPCTHTSTSVAGGLPSSSHKLCSSTCMSSNSDCRWRNISVTSSSTPWTSSNWAFRGVPSWNKKLRIRTTSVNIIFPSSSESAAAHHHHLNQHQQRASQHSREHPSHMALSKSTSCMVIWFLFIDSLEFRIVAQLRPPRNCPRTPCCSFYCMSQSIVPVKTINGVGWSAR